MECKPYSDFFSYTAYKKPEIQADGKPYVTISYCSGLLLTENFAIL